MNPYLCLLEPSMEPLTARQGSGPSGAGPAGRDATPPPPPPPPPARAVQLSQLYLLSTTNKHPDTTPPASLRVLYVYPVLSRQ